MRRIAFYSCLIGGVIVMVSMALLWCVDVVTGAFVENTAVGWCTFSGVLFVALGVFYLIGCELHGYLQVRKVDRLSIAMQGDNAALLRKRARYWLGEVHEYETCEELNIKLGDVFSLIDAKVDKMVAAEAVIVGAVVGISPWALVESGIVAWRQLRLIKRIAREYGLRPGVAGTCRLIRQIAISVVFADVSEHATQWLSSKVPSIGGLIPAAGQAIAVGVLTARVGLACKKVCNPVLNKKYARSGLPFFSSLRSFGKFGIFRARKLPTR
ncbi:MAG TPA: DUF697 domain-containing protein [Phycisphaerales bacterium]|nr:DUF697 domain-containing protein [Phycisphaerales bacterium]